MFLNRIRMLRPSLVAVAVAALAVPLAATAAAQRCDPGETSGPRTLVATPMPDAGTRIVAVVEGHRDIAMHLPEGFAVCTASRVGCTVIGRSGTSVCESEPGGRWPAAVMFTFGPRFRRRGGGAAPPSSRDGAASAVRRVAAPGLLTQQTDGRTIRPRTVGDRPENAQAEESCMKRTGIVGLGLVILLTLAPVAAQGEPAAEACWGHATRAFAHMGLLGEHASNFGTPRLGLRNLARSLHAAGVIEDDSMQALGAFVTDALGLSIDACR
jgi:hypothetical protein